MALSPIIDGQLGADVRATLNAAVALLNLLGVTEEEDGSVSLSPVVSLALNVTGSSTLSLMSPGGSVSLDADGTINAENSNGASVVVSSDGEVQASSMGGMINLSADGISIIPTGSATLSVANLQMTDPDAEDRVYNLAGQLVFSGPSNAVVNAPITPTGSGPADGNQLALGMTPIAKPASNGLTVQLPEAVGGSSCVLLPWSTNDAWAPTDYFSVYVLDDSGDDINNEGDSFDCGPAAGGIGAAQLVPFLFICPVGMDGHWFTNGNAD